MMNTGNQASSTVPDVNTSEKSSKREFKKHHRIKTDLGPDFIAPDGGWGWAVCIATGITNSCMLPMLNQFGLLFKDRFKTLGLSNAEITTLINLNAGLATFSGLLNGPIFRRFTFRQVALASALCSVLAISLSAFANSFIMYAITYSFLYGIGRGYTLSAVTLAVNTYFKKKRRRATGLAWALTSLGNIISPHITNSSLQVSGVFGTVFLYAGVAMQAIPCALILQPVHWHTKSKLPEDATLNGNETTELCAACAGINEILDYQITAEAGTTMIAESNDGFFGSLTTLASRRRSASSHAFNENTKQNLLKPKTRTTSGDEENLDNNMRRKSCAKNCTCMDARENQRILMENNSKAREKELKSLTFLEKFCIFFELDLLKDYNFVTLILGLTVTNFCEINFNILLPFVLSDLGYEISDVAVFMSLLGGMDTISRFLLPFIAERIGWENKTFFLIGIIGLSVGRIFLITFQGYSAMLACFVWIGFFRGLRIIFMTLIVPSYVPLERLPGASGLLMISTGIFSFALGPFLGAIRDATSYQVFLYCLNIGTLITLILWTAVDYINKKNGKIINSY